MDIAIVGAGMAGLSAGWWLRREGHRVLVFERHYKPGGRMNSRRKAGLVVDHGDRFIARDSPVLRELIVDCGLHGETRPIERPIYTVQPDGSFLETREQAIDTDRLTFPDGMLTLPEALRRSMGGFYSIGVTAVERDEVLGKFIVRSEPPLRNAETQVDAVVFACAAPEAFRVSQPIHALLNAPFLERLAKVEYTRCLTFIAALEKVQTPEVFYGLVLPRETSSILMWIAFEDRKCKGREVEGYSSLVAHGTPEASERFWKLDEEPILGKLYAEARRIVPELPARWRWARVKHWEVAHLKDPKAFVSPVEFPVSPEGVGVVFCGDYCVGHGVEAAAQSGREAADRLLRKLQGGAAS